MSLSFMPGSQAEQDFQALLAAKDSLVPYVGAGFSFGVCPMWGEFLTLFYQHISDRLKKTEEQQYQDLQNDDGSIDYEGTLDLLYDCAGKGVRQRFVQSLFDKPLPASSADKFALFQRAFPGPWITTNVDRLIEESCHSAYTAINGNDATRLTEWLNKGDLAGLLLKIHGDVKEPSSWVLSKQDYEKAYGSSDDVDVAAHLPAFLKRLYTSHSLLFIGCSLQQDRPLQVLEQVMDEEGVRQHFALLGRPKEDNDEHKDFVRRLSDLNITPIWLNDHSEVDAVLAQLAPPVDNPKSIASPGIFVGREKELQQLLDALSQPGSVHTVSGQLLNLVGIGGIGKTTLAREALHRCKDQFAGGCFEIRMEGLSPQGFAVQLSNKLQLDLSEPSDVEQAQQQISQMLNQHRILLLLDNVADSKELLQVLPVSCQSSIIVTSRDQELADAVRVKRRQLKVSNSHLLAFSEKESLELFQEFLGGQYQTDHETTYLAIAAQLGFLPIALRLAMSTLLFGSRYSANQLLKVLQSDQKLDLFDKAIKHDATSDERTISAVFDLSAPLLSDALKQTLAELAVCAPGPVPLDFLQHLTEQADLTESLETLVRYSWCTQSNVDDVPHYELHQLVRELIELQLVDDELKECYLSTVQYLFIEDPQHFLELDRWIGQTDLALFRLKELKDQRLIYWAAGGFSDFCEYRGHGQHFFNVCELVIDCFSQDKEYVAMALGNQALVLKDWGRLDEAMALHKREELIKEALEDQAGLSLTYGNQALILQAKGQLGEAMALHKKEELIQEELGDRAGLSRTYGNQALILAVKGQLDEAMALHQKEELIKEELGDRAGLSACYGNQALILDCKGQLEKAMALHRKQELICEALGDRVGLSACYGNQASIMLEQGRLDDSMALLLKNEVIKKELGDRAGLAICYWNQGGVYGELGDIETQKQLWGESIAIGQAIGLPTEDDEKELADLEKGLEDGE